MTIKHNKTWDLKCVVNYNMSAAILKMLVALKTNIIIQYEFLDAAIH